MTRNQVLYFKTNGPRPFWFVKSIMVRCSIIILLTGTKGLGPNSERQPQTKNAQTYLDTPVHIFWPYCICSLQSALWIWTLLLSEGQFDSLLDYEHCSHIFFRATGKLLNSTSRSGTTERGIIQWSAALRKIMPSGISPSPFKATTPPEIYNDKTDSCWLGTWHWGESGPGTQTHPGATASSQWQDSGAEDWHTRERGWER